MTNVPYGRGFSFGSPLPVKDEEASPEADDEPHAPWVFPELWPYRQCWLAVASQREESTDAVRLDALVAYFSIAGITDPDEKMAYLGIIMILDAEARKIRRANFEAEQRRAERNSRRR